MLTVNRSLDDKAMDAIDHALGRPLDPLKSTYRARYVVTDNSPEATAMRASPWWTEIHETGHGLTLFHVTQEGREALAAHLREIGDPWRCFEIKWAGTTFKYVAKSAKDALEKGFDDAYDFFETNRFDYMGKAIVREYE